MTQAARRGFAQLHQAVSAARQTAERGLVDAAVGLLRDVGYRGEIDRAYDDPDERQARWDSVEQVVNALGAYVADHPGQPQLGDFLDQLALADQDFGEQKEGQLERDAIALMTLHSAKGLEFPFVFLVGMEEGLLPHRRSLEEDPPAIDEERRLCYVGMTRAQDELTLSLSLSRMKWGKPRETQPSRFLYELTGRAEHPNYRRLVESA